MRYNFIYKNKAHGVDAVRCNSFQKFAGLMMKRKEKSKALLFIPSSEIHSFFVPFNFLAVWLDSRDRVLRIDRVKPFRFRIKPPKNSSKLLEIPINKKYEDTIKDLGF